MSDKPWGDAPTEPGPRSTSGAPNWGRIALVAGGIVLVVALIIGLVVRNTRMGAHNEGEALQAQIMKDATTVTLRVDAHLKATSLGAQIAGQERETAIKYITQAVSNTYVDPGTQKIVPASQALGTPWGAAMFRTGYPKPLSDDLYRQLYATAMGTLKDMTGAGIELANDVEDLNKFRTTQTWLTTGIRKSFPDENLIIIDPVTKQVLVKGMDALYYFSVPITGKAAADSTVSRQVEEPNLFGSPTPTHS